MHINILKESPFTLNNYYLDKCLLSTAELSNLCIIWNTYFLIHIDFCLLWSRWTFKILFLQSECPYPLHHYIEIFNPKVLVIGLGFCKGMCWWKPVVGICSLPRSPKPIDVFVPSAVEKNSKKEASGEQGTAPLPDLMVSLLQNWNTYFLLLRSFLELSFCLKLSS